MGNPLDYVWVCGPQNPPLTAESWRAVAGIAPTLVEAERRQDFKSSLYLRLTAPSQPSQVCILDLKASNLAILGSRLSLLEAWPPEPFGKTSRNLDINCGIQLKQRQDRN